MADRPADETLPDAVLIGMCEACERVPVPVHRSGRGLLLCAECLAGAGIHVGEDDPAAAHEDEPPRRGRKAA